MKYELANRAVGFSRRKLLKMGFGVAAVLAANASGTTGDVLAAGMLRQTSGGSRLPALTEVTAVSGQTVAGRTAAGDEVSASMVGFPDGFIPRVGDLVAVAERSPSGGAVPPMPDSQLSAEARCRSASSLSVSDLAAQGQLSAVPVATWRRDIPVIDQEGRLSIQGVALVEAPSVRVAAMNGTPIAVSTLDSTLDSLQVLATRA